MCAMRHNRQMPAGLLEPVKVWFEDKSISIAKAMRHLGMTPAGPFKCKVKRPSQRKRRP